MHAYSICWLPIFLLLVVLPLLERRRAEEYAAARVKQRNGDTQMQKLAERLIGKDILVKTAASGSVDGILKEVTDNALVIEKKGEEIFVNLDYVIKMREYPKGKNGKRKELIFDE